MSDEFDTEPVPGLPEHLPQGERMLWQGSPCMWGLARRAFHGGKIAVYFAALVVWVGVSKLAAGIPAGDVAVSVTRVALAGLATLGVVALLGWLAARTTLYTITDARVVMRFGIALPMTVNVPFTQIASADLKGFADGSGDIALEPVQGSPRLGYVPLWPHVRGGRFNTPQPTLRALPDANAVGEVLAKALSSKVPGRTAIRAKDEATQHEPAVAGAVAA